MKATITSVRGNTLSTNRTNHVDRGGSLSGKGVAINDSISVAGVLMTGGSHSLEVSLVLSVSTKIIISSKKNYILMNKLLKTILTSEKE